MAIAHATVVHDVAPTFGFSAKDGLRIRARAVATFEFSADRDDEQVLELLFRATNTVEAPWFEVCRRAFDVVALEPSRSTSVGDVVAIARGATTTYYLCRPIGWEIIAGELVEIEGERAESTRPGL
ncbi:MAG: hypothetical protein WAJ85_13615 [Candidatus Baltobacteraceae bacterium]